ncbi:thioredoxin family protein [Xanthomonas sp. GPE 39]|uniref:thioredoxin family protein n=1 Tax=Xanthomonas sp. GPE 39 TaxID=1583099 RepID=UPI0005F2FD38|nr:thioredoxin family protein [Xanthomonas sp. GPE 39]
MSRMLRRSAMLSSSLATLLALSACEKPPAPATPKATAPAPAKDNTGIAWHEGDLDDAFAEAREQNKPLLLYWGAVWCPPCNRLKATLFKDPAFIARTRAFVAVHLDGDLESAQAWGERFGIKGYPTIIVLAPDRSEITRLAGDSDTAHLAEALRVAANRTSSSAQLLQQALKEPATLSNDDWTILSQYDWSLDGAHLIKSEHTADVLARLAAAAPQPALQRRFALLALSMNATDTSPTPKQRATNRALLQAVVSDPAEVRANLSTLTESAHELIQAGAANASERATLSNALTQALDKVYTDSRLPISDRLETVYADIALARLAQGQPADPGPTAPAPPPLPAAVVEKIRQRVHWAEQAAHSDAERQSTISMVADLLDTIGDKAGSEQLLLAELGRSKTPYYYMPKLAGLAEERGDKQTALYWLKKTRDSVQSPSLRLNSDTRYVNGLIRLQPDNAAAIENATAQMIAELAHQPDDYLQRHRQRFDTLGKKLKDWSKQHNGNAVLARLQQKMQQNCSKQERDNCPHWLS